MNHVLVALTLAAASVPSASSAVASSPSPWGDDGFFEVTSDDDRFALKLDGRIFLDFGFHTAADGLTTASSLRRARFAVKTRLWGSWTTEWDIGVADGEVEVKDMWIAYALGGRTELKVGHFKVPFSHEELMSPSRRLAIGVATHGAWWRVGAAIFGQEVGRREATLASEGFGGAVRLTAAPVDDGALLLHFGASVAAQTPEDGAGRVRFKARPETKILRFDYLNTGWIEGVDLTMIVGGEAILRYGPLSLQGELVAARVDREGGRASVDFGGGFVQLGWILTGQTRPYDRGDGELAALELARGAQAVELALRYSHLSLADVAAPDPVDHVTGGVGNQVSATATWLFNANLRWMLGWSWADNSPQADDAGDLPEGLDRRFHLVTTRLIAGF
ncbi:MAG: hypothetical protein CSA66_01645 [Proteobacteria bacterium]|nr:MAG: hypothetical protein CSA66_01645 [Pseudomonadota bacterium]